MPYNHKEYMKEYRKKNIEKIKEYDREYHKIYCRTDEGIKINKISKWRQRGIIFSDWDLLYDIYLSCDRCDYCHKEFKNNMDRCLDHDHSINDDNNVRGILCRGCNVKDVLKSD